MDFNIKWLRQPAIQNGSNIVYFLPDQSLKFGSDLYHYSTSLASLDTALTTIKTAELNSGKRNYYLRINALCALNGKPFFLYYGEASGKMLGNLMAAEVDPVTLGLGQPKVVADVTGMAKPIKLTQNTRYYLYNSFETSADTKKTAVKR